MWQYGDKDFYTVRMELLRSEVTRAADEIRHRRTFEYGALAVIITVAGALISGVAIVALDIESHLTRPVFAIVVAGIFFVFAFLVAGKMFNEHLRAGSCTYQARLLAERHTDIMNRYASENYISSGNEDLRDDWSPYFKMTVRVEREFATVIDPDRLPSGLYFLSRFGFVRHFAIGSGVTGSIRMVWWVNLLVSLFCAFLALCPIFVVTDGSPKNGAVPGKSIRANFGCMAPGDQSGRCASRDEVSKCCLSTAKSKTQLKPCPVAFCPNPFWTIILSYGFVLLSFWPLLSYLDGKDSMTIVRTKQDDEPTKTYPFVGTS